MRRLLAALDRIERRDEAPVLLLKGEPGLGKSLLLSELARVVLEGGGTALVGRTYEAERDRPFGPWLAALDGLPLALIETARGNGGAELGRGEDRLLARERLFGAVVEAMRAQADGRPLLLAIDDVHWMDEASAALLHHAVRALRHAPVVFALTARDGELPDNPPVLGVLRGLRQERMLEEIPLEPLPPGEAAEIVRAVAPGIDAQRVAAECGGNPLLAQELARARLGGFTEAVPSSLHGLVRDRVERLPARVAEVLRWMAILGTSVSPGRLGMVVPMDLTEFMEALDLLERHALVQSAPGSEGYAFRHELIRQAVYTSLSEPRRRLMHHKTAQALRREPGAAHGAAAAEIAHHAALAGDAALAAEACLAAGQRCLRLLASAEAGMLALRGLRHARDLPEPDRTRLSLELLHVQLAASRPAQPAEAARRIEELAQRALDHGCLEQARLGFHMLSHLRWEGGLWSEAERDTLRAELVSRSADEKERVVAMAEAARCLTLLERDLGQAEAFALEAGELARRVGGSEPNAIADALGMLRLHQGAEDEAAALFERARMAARRDGDRANEFLALEHLAVLELRRGSYGRAETLCAELAELAGRLRQDGSESPFAQVLCALCRHARHDATAEATLAGALAALEAADAKHRLAIALLIAAEIDLAAGRAAEAGARASMALRLATLLDLPSEIACAHATLARAATACGDAAERERQVAALRAMPRRALSAHARMQVEPLIARAVPARDGATGAGPARRSARRGRGGSDVAGHR